jgi:hypothetical protein
MTLLPLVFIPLALGLLTAILFGTAWLEAAVLSPRSLILYSARVRSRRVLPEDVERLVALQSARLLRDVKR